MSPRWGFKTFRYPVRYKHVAPLGLKTGNTRPSICWGGTGDFTTFLCCRTRFMRCYAEAITWRNYRIVKRRDENDTRLPVHNIWRVGAIPSPYATKICV